MWVPVCCVCYVNNIRRGGLVGYDAGFTHLKSRVQFPALVLREDTILVLQINIVNEII